MKNRKSNSRKGKSSSFSKLSIFQPNKYKFKKSCPLSVKNAPKVDYKNIKLLKRYISENGKILSGKISGKCDSIHYSQITGIVQMINFKHLDKRKNPILWNGKSQITGDSIRIKFDPKNSVIDSLYVYDNALIIKKPIITFFTNTILNTLGKNGVIYFKKFEVNDLRNIIIKNILNKKNFKKLNINIHKNKRYLLTPLESAKKFIKLI